jgi:hypothetical protein
LTSITCSTLFSEPPVRHAVGEQLAVPRRLEVVERVVRGGALAHRARIDEQVLLALQAVAVVELGQRRARLEHLVEIALAAAHEAAARGRR